MAISFVVRNVGPTSVISVGAASSTAITIGPAASNDMLNFCSFLNTGATIVSLTLAANGTAPASVAPAAGVPQTVIVLPAGMVMPVIYATPQSYSVTAIGSGVGPSLVYITPVAAQS